MRKNRQKRICVLTSSRTGSSWLMQILDSHPDIKAFGEPFTNVADTGKAGPDPRLWPPIRYHNYLKDSKWPRPFSTFLYLRKLHSLTQSEKVIAYKVMYEQLVRIPELYFFFFLFGYKVVHLIRENYFDVAVSLEVMRMTKISHTFESKPFVNRYRMEPERLVDHMRRRDRYAKLTRLLLIFWPVSRITVTYTKMAENPQSTFDQITAFIKLAPYKYNSQGMFQKSLSKKPEEFIENYGEVKAVLEKTIYARFL